MDDAMKDRRHIIKIKPEFQDRLAVENVLIAFIFINILILISFFLTKSVDDAWLLRLNFIVVLVVGELCGLVVVYYYTIKASHRIAGPVYRLEKQLTDLSNGDFTTHIGLRKHDHFQDTADQFNETVVGLREKISSLQKTAQALRQESGLEGTAVELVDSLVLQLSAFRTQTNSAPQASTGEVTSGLMQKDEKSNQTSSPAGNIG